MLKDFFTQPEPSFNYVLTFETGTPIDYSPIKYLGKRWIFSSPSILKFYSTITKEELILAIAKQLNISPEVFSLAYIGDHSAMRF